MDFLELKKYSAKLLLIDDNIIKNFCSLAFSSREGNLSVAIGSNNKEALIDACKKVVFPKDFFNGNFIRWGVDLESTHTDKIRIYRMNPKSDNIRVEGFNINSIGEILEKKLYIKSQEGLIIDRYDKEGLLISSGEIEVQCEEKDWTGPKELVDAVKISGYEFNFTKKIAKNQSYLIIHKIQ
jgi:hypothetical protein